MRLSDLYAKLFGCPQEGSHTRCDSTRKGPDVEDDEQDDIDSVRAWIGQLRDFASSLDGIEGDDATDFCDSACEAWQHIALPSVTQQNPAALVIFEVLNALAKSSTTVIVDWADTPDVRDRHTRATAQQLVKDALDGVVSSTERWLSEGLPPAEQMQQRFVAVAADLKESMDLLGKRKAEMDADDAEAAQDQYGAILSWHDPSRPDVGVIVEKICSFTEEENERYREAYERLRKMLDSELYRHISDEHDAFCDVLIGILTELRDQKLSLSDMDAMDERRRKLRSALISLTGALQNSSGPDYRAARDMFGRNTPEAKAVENLFNDLKETSFEYCWLEELRDVLQHGDINAFKYQFAARLHGEPEVIVDWTAPTCSNSLGSLGKSGSKPKRAELQAKASDPSVLDMIKAIQPKMIQLQEELDKIMYPDVADDVAVVRELIGRFEGRQGQHALQSGPGFTRRLGAPPQHPLAPRVILFALNYQADDTSADWPSRSRLASAPRSGGASARCGSARR